MKDYRLPLQTRTFLFAEAAAFAIAALIHAGLQAEEYGHRDAIIFESVLAGILFLGYSLTLSQSLLDEANRYRVSGDRSAWNGGRPLQHNRGCRSYDSLRSCLLPRDHRDPTLGLDCDDHWADLQCPEFYASRGRG
ncbi:MAG: hypothetical protein HC801_02570 [Nitrospira sp.]|nr:hypothetical protein [Nitrospira sp.]